MELYEKYADVRKQLEVLKQMEEAMRYEVLEDMAKRQVVKEDLDYARFTLASRKTYTFSDKVAALKERAKLAEITEIEKGTAKVKESHYLVFKNK